MSPSPLSRVESLLRKVVEEPFTWLGSGSLDPFMLAAHLAKYYEHPTVEGERPNQFVVHVSPNDLDDMGSEVSLLERQVADYLVLMIERRGTHLAETPAVSFRSDSSETSHRAHIAALHVEPEEQHAATDVISIETPDSTLEAVRATDAFLIVQGRHHILLDRPITRIGRRADNDLILDSPSISRQHAQIRWRQNYFVLYDVSTHGQTIVNGSPVQEYILRPGDVIALSNILMVYGEGREDNQKRSVVLEDDELDTTMIKDGE